MTALLSGMRMNQKPGQLIVERINQTRRQVRTVELVTTLVTLAACLLMFLLVSVLVDHWVFKNGTPLVLRYLGLAGITGAGVVYFVLRLIPLIRFSINPAYAAEVLEQWHPGMKNRLVNWVFLRREKRGKSSPVTKMEQMVIESIGRETAANLRAIPDQFVVDCTAMIRWGIVLVCVLALFCVSIIFSPKSTLQSVGRAAIPLVHFETPQSIVIKEVEPGNADVYQGETLQIKARLDRSTKKPVHVVYSTGDGRLVDQRVPMQAGNDGMRFECRFPPGKRGFEESLTYRIEVADARSKNYSVTVNPSIAMDVKSVEYHYPAYTRLPMRTAENSGDLRAVEGTEVVITARSNIAMSQATLIPDGDTARAVKLQIAPSKTEAHGPLTLGFDPNQPDKPVCTTYTLRCWDDNQRTNPLPSVYRLEVVRDEPPAIKWVDGIDDREPMQLALNEPLEVAVEARDPDFGLHHVRLRGTVTRVIAGAAVRQGNTLPETSDLPLETIELLQNPPRTGTVVIKKTLVPSKLRLQVGDRVTYFAEAVDTKDPNANSTSTSSRVFVVTEVDPDKPLDPQVNDESQEQQSGNSEQSSEDEDSGEQSENQDTNNDAGQEQSQDGNKSGDEATDQNGQDQQRNDSTENETDEQKQSGQTGSQSNQKQNQPQEPSQDQQQDRSDGNEQQMTAADDSDGNPGDQDQQNPRGGQQSDGSNDGSNNGAITQETGGDQSPTTQNDQTDGQQNANNQQGREQNQPDQEQNQPNQPGQRQDQPGQQTQNNGRNSGKPKEKIDGDSNPGDVIDEVLNHIRETGDFDDTGRNDGNRQQPNGNGDQVSGGPAPDHTPEHDDLQTVDHTDALQTQNGYDPHAEELDPNTGKPIYRGTDNRDDATEADTPGHSLTDDSSQGDSPRRENAQPDDTHDAGNARASAGDVQQSERQENQSSDDRGGERQTTQDDGQPNASSAGGESSQQPQPPGNDNDKAHWDGTSELSGDGGGGLPQDRRQGTPADNTPEPQADAANLEYTRQATEMVIRYLEDELGKERPDPRLLERLGGWNENDLRRFVERWKEMQQQANHAPDTKEGQRLDDTLRSIGNLTPKATVSQQRINASQTRTTTTEAQRFAPPPGKYEDRMKAYTEGINR
ncbi:MAG: hypothetical protein FWH27_01465 [Planctomycetaceae bacterium]|nr:hypothetical protein [Planctomycetaceae bacterium]